MENSQTFKNQIQDGFNFEEIEISPVLKSELLQNIEYKNMDKCIEILKKDERLLGIVNDKDLLYRSVKELGFYKDSYYQQLDFIRHIKDVSFLRDAVESGKNINILNYANNDTLNKVVTENPDLIRYVGVSNKVKAILEKDENRYNLLSPATQGNNADYINNLDLVIDAVKKTPDIINQIHKKELLNKISKEAPEALEKLRDRWTALEIVKENNNAYHYLSDDIKGTREIMEELSVFHTLKSTALEAMRAMRSSNQNEIENKNKM